MVRITSENISNLGINVNNNPKQEAAMEWLYQNKVDIAGWIEDRIAWHKLRRKNRLQQQLKIEKWRNPQVITSKNRHDGVSLRQLGGTATLTIWPIPNTYDKRGSDPDGLGWWLWIQLAGSEGVTTIIITAYNPCKSKLNRPQTVYAQQNNIGYHKRLTRVLARYCDMIYCCL